MLKSNPILCWTRAVTLCLAGLGVHPDSASSQTGDASDLLASREAATLMRYIVGCALPKGQSAELTSAGKEEEYFGAFGLAPEWANRPMTQLEQMRVSACLLARTNALGVKVSISLRAGTVDLDAYEELGVTEQERADYSVFEGAFWGNVFTSPPTAFVCFNPELYRSILIQLKRLCTVMADTPEAAEASV